MSNTLVRSCCESLARGAMQRCRVCGVIFAWNSEHLCKGKRTRVALVAIAGLVLFAACGAEDRHVHRLTDPDAGVDSAADAAHCELDAGADDCCRFAPDTNAMLACFGSQLPENSCGVIVCRLADCTPVEVNACGPVVHVDGGSQ